MVFISKIFFFMMYTPNIGKTSESSVYILGQILAIPFIFLTLIPFYYIDKTEKGCNILTLSRYVNKKFSMAVGLFYWAYMIFTAVNTSINFDFYLTSAVYPESKSMVFIFVIVLSAMYCTMMGIEPLARFSGFVIITIIISGLLIFFPLLNEINLSYINLPKSIQWSEILKAVYYSVISKNEFVLLYIINDHTDDNLSKGVSKYVFWEVGFYELVSVFTLAVFGSNSKMLMYPLYMLSNMARLSVLERTDAIHAVIWIFVAFIKISLFITAATKILSERFSLSYKKAAFLNTAVTMFFSLALSKSFNALYNIRLFTMTGVLFLIFSFVIPVTVILLVKTKKLKVKRSV